ncbi:MAG: 3'-5' exonuclease [Burkholderiales bacterium]|nr:3'-5' exonuclease [Burkholderiales bacterium]
MGWPVLVFDIETIPDVSGMRALGLGHSADAPTPAATGAAGPDADAHTWAAWQAERAAQGKSDMVPLHLHRVLVISCVFRNAQGLKVRSFVDHDGCSEGQVIQSFFQAIERHSPQLVSWNGGGFDLPVLHYRGLMHGVEANRYWDMGDGGDHDSREFKWNNYISRYHTRHVDLMDLLAMYQPKNNAPLDAMAKLCGFPGKLGMSGAEVYPAWLRGELDTIRQYCETDVLNTYLLYCRFQTMRGGFTADEYAAEVAFVRASLQAKVDAALAAQAEPASADQSPGDEATVPAHQLSMPASAFAHEKHAASHWAAYLAAWA